MKKILRNKFRHENRKKAKQYRRLEQCGITFPSVSQGAETESKATATLSSTSDKVKQVEGPWVTKNDAHGILGLNSI